MPAARILEGGAYSLVAQAKEYPDGFGLGWYPEDGLPDPVRVKGLAPAWRIGPELEVPRRYPSPCALACVRRVAQPPPEVTDLQPFANGPFLFAYDGLLEAFGSVFLRPLRERLSPTRYQTLRGSTEAELLFATWLDALGQTGGPEASATALESMVSIVHDIAYAARVAASFAIVVTDGHNLVTLRTATQGPAPPLYTLVAPPSAPVPATGRVIASEPLFPGEWTSLDTHSLVTFSVEHHEEALP